MTDFGNFGRVPAAPSGKLYVRDPETGETILVDADPETIDTSATLSGMADVSDPENPIPADAEVVEEVEAVVEVVEPAVEVVEEAEIVEVVEEVVAPVEPAVEVETVEEVAVEEAAVVEAVKPAPAKRGRPKKAHNS